MKTATRLLRCNAWGLVCLLGLFLARAHAAQDLPAVAEILKRLDRLDEQNQALREEVRVLREEVGVLRAATMVGPPETSGPTIDERLAVAETRIEEQAQTKVEASQRFPIRLRGMALVNAFTNSAYGGDRENPTVAALDPGPRTIGGTVRQSVIGLDFRGPSLPWDGSMSGSLMMDFYAGAGDSLNQYFRIRTASVDFNWGATSLMFGQEKPIISPRDPNSLAQVGVSPLTNAGNLWLWQPQARLEHDFTFGEGFGLRAQAGVYQLRETAAYVPEEYEGLVERSRPAFQGRFEFHRESSGGSRIEIAPGFHVATSHVAGISVPSRMLSVDWFLKPARRFEFTGMFFKGKNVAGMGALRQGFNISDSGTITPVHSVGGWSQFTFAATRRLSFNLFGGQQDDRDSDLPYGGFSKNQAYGVNLMLRLTPNVMLSIENLRTWTTYVGKGTRQNNHYDLAVAYFF